MHFKKLLKKITSIGLVLALSAGCAGLAMADENEEGEAVIEEAAEIVQEQETVPEPEVVEEVEPVSEPELVMEPETPQTTEPTTEQEQETTPEPAQKTTQKPTAEPTEENNDNTDTQETVVQSTGNKTTGLSANDTTSVENTGTSQAETVTTQETKGTGAVAGGTQGTDNNNAAEAVKADITAEEILETHKEGIYVALREAGMEHAGAASVMAAMDAVSEFEVAENGLLGWTDKWKNNLDEFSEGQSASYVYQTAYLLDTIENPEGEGTFDALKTALMSDESTVLTDIWYFTHYYVDKVNPNNEIDINDCLDLAKDYMDKYDEIKDSYGELTSIFEMSESIDGQAVIDYACKFIGNPYVWGGTSLTDGADCSGFIQSVYAHFGVSLPHYSGALRSVGYEVSSDEMLPGDIICYDGHCAIYLGNGKIVHASNSKPYPAGGIKVSDNYNYRTVLAIRRIFEPNTINIEPVKLTKPTENNASETHNISNLTTIDPIILAKTI